MIEKYYNENGEVGILISRGFGAGWSTCDYNHGYDIAMDKRIIEKWLTSPNSDEMKEFLNSIGYEGIYMGGYKNLYLEFIEPGTLFYIDEYDGAESLVTQNDNRFCMA